MWCLSLGKKMVSENCVFYSLSTQFDNLGDCIINQLVIEQSAHHSQVHVLCRGVPSWLRVRLSGREGIVLYDAAGKYFVSLFVRLIRRSNVSFLFKPGHLGGRRGVLPLVRLAASASFCRVFKLFGGRIVRAGCSLGPDFSRSEQFFQKVIGRCHSVYGVRDDASIALATAFGIPGIVYTPDLAFLLPFSNGIGECRGRVAVSFRSRGWMASGFGSVLGHVQAFCGESGKTMTVIQQVMYDEQVTKTICSETGCDAVRFVQSEFGVNQVFGSLRESEFMISNRLHSLLFGWASGVIPVAVVDDTVDEKIVSLFGSLGLGGLVVLVSEVDRLPEVLREVSTQADAWRKKLSQVFEKQNQVLVEIIERLYH